MDYLERAEQYARKLAATPERRFTHLTPADRGLAVAFEEELGKLRNRIADLESRFHRHATKGEAE